MNYRTLILAHGLGDAIIKRNRAATLLRRSVSEKSRLRMTLMIANRRQALLETIARIRNHAREETNSKILGYIGRGKGSFRYLSKTAR